MQRLLYGTRPSYQAVCRRHPQEDSPPMQVEQKRAQGWGGNTAVLGM
jgi:hypothetical protein